jgi:cysteine desulfurase / selenocysteine lyase
MNPLGTPLSPADDPWLWWRSLMPITEQWAYFDHAAVAPLPQPTAAAICDFADQAARLGDTLWPQWAEENERLRAEFADLLHCEAAEIALIPNTSYGINLVAEGIRWEAGDNIVIPAGEFPSNVFPWQNQQRHGVQLRVVPGIAGDSGTVDTAALLAAIDSRTRIVAASWVGYASGYRLDLQSLVAGVHQAGALFFLDAIQGLGVFPLDLRSIPIDFLAADGHKWLLGPEGAGVAMIRQQHLDLLQCVPVGWNSVRAAHQFGHAELDLKPAASRFEIGSQNMLGMRALRQSLAIFAAVTAVHGPSAIADRVLGLTARLNDALRRVGASTSVAESEQNRSGIVTFALPGVSAARIRQLAAERQVAVSCRGIGVRVSIHAYNNESDIQRLIDAIESL